MNIFKNAKIKLTVYYMLILMSVTLGFSFVIFASVSFITDKALDNQLRRFEHEFNEIVIPYQLAPPTSVIRPNTIETLLEIRYKVAANLVLINLTIWAISGVLAYYLAGKTLKPVEEMHNQQKRFVSDAAHEMKTPLTVMKTELEVLLRDKNMDLQTAKATLVSNLEEINRLTQLTKHLLALSKLTGENGYSKEKVNLVEVIEETAKKINSTLVKTTLVDAAIWANKADVTRVITNLIDNALKYNRDNNPVTVVSEIKNKHVLVRVKDNGIGIAKDDLPHIFEPFYKVDVSRTKTEVSGVGLGLAIVNEIICKNNGTITVESELNQGSTFTVEFPLSENSQTIQPILTRHV
jgi:signal transduction histidine kinase